MLAGKKAKIGLCPDLLSHRECCTRGCTYSHKSSKIKYWRGSNAKITCPHGRDCSFLITGNCVFFHREEDRVREVRRQHMERIAEVTGGLVDLEIVTAEHLAVDGNFIGITDDRDLASFNKISDSEIAVPGCPPQFHPLVQPVKIPQDSGNKAIPATFPRYTHPLEPLLRSVETMQPGFDILESVDVVSNAGNLRKLFDLLCNTTWMLERYDVEVRGTTLLISRWNDDPNLARTYGRGAGFERETCRYAPDDDPVLRRSASHHRVVTYRFGGLQCLVQSEVDAYFCDCGHSGSEASPLPCSRSRPGHPLTSPPNPLSPATVPSALTLGDQGDSPVDTAASAPTSPLKIYHVGRRVPSPCLIEIKTRNGRTPQRSTYEPQLYFSRRKQLYLAKHDRGLFEPRRSVAVGDSEAHLKAWEEQEQATLQKLAALLVLIRNGARVLKGSGVERVSLVCGCDGSGRDEGVMVRFCVSTEGKGEGLLPP